MRREIGLDDIENLSLGSAFLGAGGGGDPYLGSLLCREAIANFGPVPLLRVEDLSDGDSVFVAAAMGAPTVMIEKLFSLDDQHRAVSALEEAIGRQASVITSAEIGGCNSMMPVAYAAMRGLPILDADGMGRAFPALQMTSFNIEGVGCTPMALADEFGNSVIFRTDSAKKAEDLARPLVSAMGASSCMSCYPMTGVEAKRSAVPATLSAAIDIGAAISDESELLPPLTRLLRSLRAHKYYRHAYNLFSGKIVDVEKNTRGGWVFGRCSLAALEGRSTAEIVFQNENLTVHVDGALRCIVPDLITVVDLETAAAIPTERLAYGQRVAVIGCSAPPHIRSDKALAVVGPKGFGLSEEFVPIERISANDLSA